MNVYAVGEKYNPKVASWPEGTQYNFRSGAHELLMFFAGPTEHEIKQIKTGAAEFGLLFESDIIFLLARFGDLSWIDAPYHWSMLPENEKVGPAAPEGDSLALLQVILIDAKTGVIKALRVISLSAANNKILRNAIGRQAANPITPQEYNRRVDAVYKKYPSTNDMVV